MAERMTAEEVAFAYCANEMWSGHPCGVAGCPYCGGADFLGDERMSDKPRQIVTEPRWGWECWCEKRVHTGSLRSRYAGCYSRCEKDRAKGYLTCHWHRRHEVTARRRALKAGLDFAKLGLVPLAEPCDACQAMGITTETLGWKALQAKCPICGGGESDG